MQILRYLKRQGGDRVSTLDFPDGSHTFQVWRKVRGIRVPILCCAACACAIWTLAYCTRYKIASSFCSRSRAAREPSASSRHRPPRSGSGVRVEEGRWAEHSRRIPAISIRMRASSSTKRMGLRRRGICSHCRPKLMKFRRNMLAAPFPLSNGTRPLGSPMLQT